MDEIPLVKETDKPSPDINSFVSARWRRRLCWSLLSMVVLGGVGVLWWLSTAPSNVVRYSVTVTSGQSVSEVVAQVAEAGLVRSESLLYLVTQVWYQNETIEIGTYTFAPDSNLFAVAKQLMLTTPPDELVRVTFLEGLTNADMALVAADALPAVSVAEFVSATAGLEGELWPETYLVPVTFTTTDLVDLLTTSQDVALAKLLVASATTSDWSEADIINLASIVQREANEPVAMGLVAGILRNRLEIDMPLQADATIAYVLDTPLGELPAEQLAKSLREINSPYNTYKHKGLPPTPIGNPGRNALEAALAPTPSDYLFYITGNDGKFYYAKTFDQHRLNIARHLR